MTATDKALQNLRSNLDHRIAALGTSAREVSERAGLNPGAVGDILSGRSKNPGIRSIAAIAVALGCDPSDLVGATPPSPLRRSRVVPGNIADAIAAIVDPIGGIELELLPRRTRRKLPDFSEAEDDAA